MYYLRISPTSNNKLVYYCRKCGNEDNNTPVCVSSQTMKKQEEQSTGFINQYTKFDPTLPRIDTILCPNIDCPGEKGDSEREIIYIRYDDTNMKYMYLCANCDTQWKA